MFESIVETLTNSIMPKLVMENKTLKTRIEHLEESLEETKAVKEAGKDMGDSSIDVDDDKPNDATRTTDIPHASVNDKVASYTTEEDRHTIESQIDIGLHKRKHLHFYFKHLSCVCSITTSVMGAAFLTVFS